MHVLQIVPRYFPNVGGIEALVQGVSEKLVMNGINVSVFSVDLSHGIWAQEKINGVSVKRFSPLIGDPFYIPNPKFATALLDEGADIIHVHNVHTTIPFIVALFKRKKQKLVLQPHYHRFGQSPFRDSLLRLYKHMLNNVVFPRADLVIANSTYERDALRKDFPNCENVVLIPEGMDVDEVKYVKRNPAEPKRILYVGALRRYKNVDKVIEGFAQLMKKHGEFRLTIVGDGQERKRLADLARKLNVGAFVEWKRNLPKQQLLQEYAGASAFITLSPLESFSRVIYEALLVGLPVVALNSGVTAHLIKAGLVEGVNSLDPEDIANALLKAMGKTCPKVIEGSNTFLDWDNYLNSIVDLYRELLKDLTP